MTAVTLTELSVADLPMNILSGTGKRRRMYFIRATSAAATDNLVLTTYDASISDIEGIMYQTIGNAVSATAVTWSTATITFADSGPETAHEVGVVCNIT